MRLKHVLLYIFLAILIQSCYEDYELSDGVLIQQEEDVYYDGELAGKVVDETGLPLTGMEIVFANDMRSTGAKGMFHVAADKLLHQGELLTISTPSNFSYFHHTFPSQNDIHYDIVNCYTDRTVAITNANNFNTIINEDCTISGNEVEFLLNNLSYPNEIRVEGYQIDLKNDNNSLFFPNARTSRIESPYLKKLAGLHFQWSTSDGQHLSLASDSEVMVHINSTVDEAGIFIYYFNSDLSIWEQQEEAIRENGGYTFSVTKDGYYCIGIPQAAVHVDGHVNSRANPVPNARVDIHNKQGELINRTHTSSTGAWHAIIPNTENLVISVQSFCETELARVEINPSQVEGSDIVISIDQLPTFAGALKTCKNELVEGGILFTDKGHFLYLPDGQFDAALPLCDQNEISLSAYSLTTQQESASLSWRPQASNHIQSLFICDIPKDNYIALRADGQMRYYEVTNSSIGFDSRMNLTAMDGSDVDFSFDLKLPQQNPGSAPLDQLNIQFNDKKLGNDGYHTACVSTNADCGFELFKINHVGAESGDWICGNFTAKFWMRTTNLSPNLAYNNRTIEGEFRVKRNY